jgi:hypothetical protein
VREGGKDVHLSGGHTTSFHFHVTAAPPAHGSLQRTTLGNVALPGVQCNNDLVRALMLKKLRNAVSLDAANQCFSTLHTRQITKCTYVTSQMAHRTVRYKAVHAYRVKQSLYTPWRRLRGEEYNSYSFTTSALHGGEWSASRPGRALPPGKGPPVPIVQEAGWAPEPVWTQEVRGKILCPRRGSNSDRPVVQPVVRHYTA